MIKRYCPLTKSIGKKYVRSVLSKQTSLRGAMELVNDCIKHDRLTPMWSVDIAATEYPNVDVHVVRYITRLVYGSK